MEGKEKESNHYNESMLRARCSATLGHGLYTTRARPIHGVTFCTHITSSLMNLLSAFLLCLHLLAASLWVGGMATMHFAVRPAAAVTLEPPLRLPFMTAALGRFFGWVSVAVLLLLATGFAMVGMAGGFARVHWSVHAMLALGLVMMALFGHLRFGAYPKLRRQVAAFDWAAAAVQLHSIRSLVVVNLALGVLVFIVAIVGRAL